MKKNRIISFIVTLTMLLSSLSGLTSITANADGEPALSDFILLNRYKSDFSTWTATSDDADTNPATLTNYDDTNWEQSGRVGVNSSHLVQAKTNKNDLGNGVLTFKNTTEDTRFYYEYEVRLAIGSCELSLQGVDGDTIVLDTPYNNDKSKAYKYTTVVDGDTAYTYDKEKNLVKTAEFTGKATGLILASKGGEVLLQSLSYGKIVDIPQLSDFVFDEQDKPTFADWTADAGIMNLLLMILQTGQRAVD